VRRSYAKQRDKNEPEIVIWLEARGCSVTRIEHGPARSDIGVPDLLVGYRGHTLLVEVKMPPGPRGGTKHHHAELNEDQRTWHDAWRGEKPVIVRTVADVERLLAAMAAPLTLDEVKNALEAGGKERAIAEQRAGMRGRYR